MRWCGRINSPQHKAKPASAGSTASGSESAQADFALTSGGFNRQTMASGS